MKVLVACECSGRVRDAFIQKGHVAISCDLKPSDSDRGPHYQGSVFDILGDGFDLMIAHPPCQFLSYAGTRHWNQPGRIVKRLEALEFFRKLWEADIGKICIENPRGCASPIIAKYSQIIQPFYFGDPHYKTTCLWLKNLPPLIHRRSDDLFEKRTHADKPQPLTINKSGKRRYFTDAYNRDPAKRAETFHSIAAAMAAQWG
jgi:hypothetical protein